MKRTGLVVLASLLGLATGADAGTLSLQFTGGPGVKVVYGARTVNTMAGDFKLTVGDGTGLEALPDSEFYTFCIDLDHYATTPLTGTLGSMSNWAIGDYPTGTNTQGRGRAAFLGNRYFADYPAGDNHLTTNIAAAYQIAIWELLYESSHAFDVSAGHINFSNVHASVLTQAGTLIAESAGNSATAGWLQTDNTGLYAQDYMTPLAGQAIPEAAVPEPLSTFGGFAITLAVLGGFRRYGRAH